MAPIGDWFSLVVSVAGLGITAVTATVSSRDKPGAAKYTFVALTLLGFLVGGVGAVSAARSNEQLTASIGQLKSVLALVDSTVGQLGTLQQISGGAHYYVRIAAGRCGSKDLADAAGRLKRNFRGADDRTVAEVQVSTNLCHLTFGRHLGMVAAEVFERLADAHHLPPPGQIAFIEVEPAK